LNQFYKNLALWLVISLMMIMLFNMFQKPRQVEDKLSFSEFMSLVDEGKVNSVILQGNDITGKYAAKDGKEKQYRSYKPTTDAGLTEKLLEKKITIQAKPEEERFSWFSLFISWFPLLLLVGIWIFFMRQMQVGGGKAMSFGKSRAKLLTESSGKVTFEDVAGIEEAKEELEEIIAFLKDPKNSPSWAARSPKGCYWWALLAPARPCWPVRWLVKPEYHSSPSPAPTLWRCSWASVPAGSATCFYKARRALPASSLLTKLTP